MREKAKGVGKGFAKRMESRRRKKWDVNEIAKELTVEIKFLALKKQFSFKIC